MSDRPTPAEVLLSCWPSHNARKHAEKFVEQQLAALADAGYAVGDAGDVGAFIVECECKDICDDVREQRNRAVRALSGISQKKLAILSEPWAQEIFGD